MPPRETTAVGYRRNGKKQACEPCRKGKLACDHGSPFCGRCVRRKTTTKCIYHPAPMTRIAQSTPKIVQPPSPRQTPSIASIENVQQNKCSGISQSATNNHSCLSHPKPGWKYALFPSSSRYYGPTSFSAIFTENQVKLNDELLDISENVRKHPGAWRFGEPLAGQERPNGPTARQRQTVKVLRNLPSKEICSMLISPAQSPVSATTLDHSLMVYFNNSLWSTFEKELAYPRTDENLAIISDALFNSEEHPLPPSPDDGIEWANTFCGDQIRFEVLGLYFCYIGMAYRTLQDWDPIFKVPENLGRDRMETTWRMNECAEVCLKMCDFAETVNYFVPALILNLKRLQTGCTGDDTYQMRRLHGDMVTTAITSGLHRLPPYDTGKVTAASEFKKRLWSSIYCNDKTHASLYGTPPLLTRIFCDVEACLDLPDEILRLSAEEISLALANIDPNGWRYPHIHGGTTVLRGKVRLSVVREEILEVALGVNVEVSKARIAELHERGRHVYDSLPDSLHFYGVDKTPKASAASLLYDQAHTLLLHLQNKFLTDRVAIARGLANEQNILETAMEIMDISLMFWSKRDQMMAYSANFDWIICYFTIPAAGAICVQLLRSSAGQSSTSTSTTFSRTEAIQKMTLFIAFLEWVRPTDGNYALAQRLRVVVQRVLSYVLEPPQASVVVNTNASVGSGSIGAVNVGNENGSGEAFDPMLGGFDDFGLGVGMGIGSNDLDWLNTIDWTQGSWMEFN